LQPKHNKPIAASFKTQTAKRIAAQSAAAVLATAVSYANQTYKPDAVLKLVVVAVSVDLSETEICKQHVAPVRIGLIPQTPAALQASVDLSKTPISKRIAEQQVEVVAANAVLSASQICKPCAAQRRVAAQVNVDLYAIGTCRRLVGRRLSRLFRASKGVLAF